MGDASSMPSSRNRMGLNRCWRWSAGLWRPPPARHDELRDILAGTWHDSRMYDRQHDRSQELVRQRAALGRFGELSLKSDDLDEILTEACGLVSNALGTDLAKVLACHENGTELLVRAGVGWKPGIVGQTTIPIGEFSAAGHALHTGQPVISNDVEQESRFEVPDFMREHGVKAM